jgi:ABC-type sugar transport system ATPase subunit
MTTTTRPLLQTRLLKAGYYGREVVRAVNLTVQPGEVVCLLGPNGAGKSTTLLTIAGELEPVDGVVLFNNVPTYTPMHQRVRTGGIGLVTEERLVFTKMSARDNLRVGGGSADAALALFQNSSHGCRCVAACSLVVSNRCSPWLVLSAAIHRYSSPTNSHLALLPRLWTDCSGRSATPQTTTAPVRSSLNNMHARPSSTATACT